MLWLACCQLLQHYLFHDEIDLNKLMLSGLGIFFFNLLIMNAYYHRAIRRTISAVLMQNALPAITFLLLLLGFFASIDHEQLFINLYTISLIIAGVASTYIISPDIDLSKDGNNQPPPDYKNILRQSLPLALVALAPFIMLWADTVMVGLYLSTADIALFNMAARVSFVSLFFLGALDATIYPRLLNIHKNNPDKLKDFFWKVYKLFPKALKIGFTVIFITAVVIFPYWYWSKTDPISQVSIPHGSRANFILEPNLGLVFFLIPWGLMLFFLPGIFYRLYKKRNILLGLSFSLAFVLGTGGTTPIPFYNVDTLEASFQSLSDAYLFLFLVVTLPPLVIV